MDAALLLQLEQQRAGRRDRGTRRRSTRSPPICSRTPSKHEFAVKNPPQRRRQERRGDRQGASAARAATSSAKASAPRSARAGRSASRSRTSATRRPTSGSTTGSAIRSTTARRPTCRTCASPTRRSPTSRPISSGLKGPAGDAAKATPDQKVDRRCAARLPEERDAVRGREGAAGEVEPAAEAGRARAARDQPLRLLQLPRHQGLREGAVDRHRPVGRGQQAGHAARLRVHHRHPAHVEDRVVQRPSCTIRASSTRAACCSRSRSCGCRTSTSPTKRSSGCSTAIMSFQREIQPPAAMPARSARYDYSGDGPHARPPPQLRRLPHHRRRRRRLPQAGRGSVAGPADADAGRRARAARLAVRVPARTDHDPAVAERPDADLRARRSRT